MTQSTRLALALAALAGCGPTYIPRAATFSGPAGYSVGIQPVDVVTADFNGDGRSDVAAADYGDQSLAGAGEGAVAVLLDAGGGTLGLPTMISAGATPSALAAGDLDGDGKPDLAIVSGGALYVAFNDGTGAFGGATPFAGVTSAVAVALGDLDGDGRLDLAVATQDGVTALVNQGGPFASTAAWAHAPGPSAIALADLDGDGRLDLAAGGVDGVTVLQGGGNGRFTRAGNYDTGTAAPVRLVAADLNGDGRPELALAQHGSSDLFSTTPGSLRVLRNLGALRFSVGNGFSAGGFGVVAGDFNRDGHVDLATVARSSDAGGIVDSVVEVHLGRGDLSFAGPNRFVELGALDGGQRPAMLASGDFDGDNVPDLVVADNRLSANPGSVTLLLDTTPPLLGPGH